MQLGLIIDDFTVPGGPTQIRSEVGRIAEEADEAGLAHLWVMDHFFQIPYVGDPEREMLEGYSVLAYAAGRTERIELGTIVTGVPYRHPGVLVKTVTALDVLSGGRAWLGIGAAWNEDEARSLGIPFPPMGIRFEWLEETLRIAHQMWAGDERPFVGEHFRLERPMNSPNSLRRPHPPILVGGSGERKTLRFVARYADACNILPLEGPESYPRKLDVLRRHCDELGRAYEEILKTAALRLAITASGGKAAAIAQIRELGALGFDGVLLSLEDLYVPGAMTALGALVEAAHDIVPAGREAVAA
jgi:F420-dependent oxidoreductase-like protein